MNACPNESRCCVSSVGGRTDLIFVFYLFFFPKPGEQLGHWADQVLSVGTETKATGKFLSLRGFGILVQQAETQVLI